MAGPFHDTLPEPDDRELALLRALDGEASGEELRLLEQDVHAVARLRVDRGVAEGLRQALREAGCQPPEVDRAVMAALGLDGPAWSLADVVAELGGRAPELAGPVLAELGLDDGLALVAGVLAEQADDVPDLAGSVMAFLGLEHAAEAAVSQALREATAEPSPDLAGAVMASLGLDAAWEPVAVAVREEASLGASMVQVAPAVLAAVTGGLPPPEQVAPEAEVGPSPAELQGMRLSALHDGELGREARLELARALAADRALHAELAGWADLGRMVRESVELASRDVGLDGTWAAVAPRIGIEEPEEVPGWAPMAAALREAVRDAGRLEGAEARRLTQAVMNALPSPRPEPVLELSSTGPSRLRLWARFFVPAVALSASALLVLVTAWPSLLGSPGTRDPVVEEQASNVFELASVNRAEVEALEYAQDVVVQVIQLEGDSPMILLIDEGPGPAPESL